MAAEAMVSVGYEGKQYQIPADVARLNATQPGVARDYIEEMIAEKADRQARAKAQREESVEAEFTSVKTRLSELESERAVTKNLQRENKSLKATVDALVTQLATIESSGNAAGSASAEAREAAISLANASSIAFGALTELRSQNDRLNSTIEKMEARLAELELAQAKQITESLALGKERMNVVLEASNRAVDKGYEAEGIARKAEAVAAQALSDAKAAQSLSRNDITRENVMAMITMELQAQAPEMVNQAIDTIKEDEFGGKTIFGQRMDGDYIRQKRSDADAARNIR